MLRNFRATLYGLALLLATPALAEETGAGFRDRLVAVEPYAPTATGFTRRDGSTGDLSDYAGQVVVLNFWATWCGPCKAEMPSLQALQDAMGAGDLEVVTVAFGRHNPVAMERFWAEAGVRDLPLHLDASTDLARGLGVRGLPHTLVLDRAGRVVAELVGEADWASPEARAALEELLDAG